MLRPRRSEKLKRVWLFARLFVPLHIVAKIGCPVGGKASLYSLFCAIFVLRKEKKK